jgi:electron transfer flavoprotein alpha subunit
MSNILVVAEHAGGSLKKGTLAVIDFAKQAADKIGGGFDVVVVGPQAAQVGTQVAGYGAGTVYTVEGAAFAQYTSPAYAHAIAEVVAKSGAKVVAAAASSFGKDCLPRVAVKLEAGMASDVVGIGGGETLTYLRPMWAGNVVGEVEITTPIHAVTVRTAEFETAEAAGGATPVETFSSTFDASQLKQRLVEFKATVSARPDLSEANVVVAGGRGVKSKENFELVYALADTLGAAVGATRAAVDADYIENDYQIGQTGKIIAPDLYIGLGISGAIQHLAGMKASKVIVAVNKDEDAPIFTVADYGLVADLFKVTPELTEKLQKLKSQ